MRIDYEMVAKSTNLTVDQVKHVVRVVEHYHGAKIVPDNDYAFMAQVVGLPNSKRRTFMKMADAFMDGKDDEQA